MVADVHHYSLKYEAFKQERDILENAIGELQSVRDVIFFKVMVGAIDKFSKDGHC